MPRASHHHSQKRVQRHTQEESFLHRHSLSLVAAGLVGLWIILYAASDPDTHAGVFLGNAIADWAGVLVTVLATKVFFEVGSAESREPLRGSMAPITRILRNHSLTIFLVLTGTAWIAIFLHSNPQGKWGGVIGSLVSEWTQIAGLVLLTKRLVETHSKESAPRR
jgi:hypothetical protein